MKTIDKIITKLNIGLSGAPMGRNDVGTRPNWTKVYDRAVPLNKGGYDRGGAYWGIGDPLRVEFTEDLTYVHFYRQQSLKS